MRTALPVFLLDDCQLTASAAAAHQTGDTQQGQSSGSGNLIVEEYLEHIQTYVSTTAVVYDTD